MADDPNALHHMAIDSNGRPLPYSPAQVRAIVARAIRDGDILAAVVEVDGALHVQVFRPPSKELAEIFETVARAYRRLLEGH